MYTDRTTKTKTFALKTQAQSSNDDLSSLILFYRARLKNLIDRYLYQQSIGSDQKKALGYSLYAGGKSLRALLIYFSGKSLAIAPHHLDSIALSVELAHTYTLIHDDLPCMDDDCFRRHRPSHHKVFGQAASILTGDALAADAIYLICQDKYLLDTSKVKLIEYFTRTLGSENLIQGQWLDLYLCSENLDDLKKIHLKKTAELFSFALSSPVFLSKTFDHKLFEKLWSLGQSLGLAYQIQDDLIDAQGSFSQRGKLASSDLNKGILHFISQNQASSWLKDIKIDLFEQLISCYGPNSLLNQLIFDRVLTLEL